MENQFGKNFQRIQRVSSLDPRDLGHDKYDPSDVTLPEASTRIVLPNGRLNPYYGLGITERYVESEKSMKEIEKARAFENRKRMNGRYLFYLDGKRVTKTYMAEFFGVHLNSVKMHFFRLGDGPNEWMGHTVERRIIKKRSIK
jgi:hypothetical protein